MSGLGLYQETPLPKSPSKIIYPESDGKRMADNTLQFRWITTLQNGIQLNFRENPDVFVAGDLLWYPNEGDNKTSLAPDVMVAFGRPKGDRGSYLQWKEQNIAPQVVFEVISPCNTSTEMAQKRNWYGKYGVEEYYEYDPMRGTLKGWRFYNQQSIPIPMMEGWTSPRLKITFSLSGKDLVLTDANDKLIVDYNTLATLRDEAEIRAEQERLAREQAENRAEQERLAREQERLAREKAETRVEQERLAREQERLAREKVEAQMADMARKLAELQALLKNQH